MRAKGTKRKRCRLCGAFEMKTNGLVQHSFGALDGRSLEITNCEDSEACYKRCNENWRLLDQYRRPPRRMFPVGRRP